MPNATVAAPSLSLGLVGLKMAGALLLLLAVILAGFWVIKRFGPKAGIRFLGQGDLELLGRLSLGPRRSIAVVRFLNKRLVIGVTETSINLLTEYEADHAQPSATPVSRNMERPGPGQPDPGPGPGPQGGLRRG